MKILFALLLLTIRLNAYSESNKDTLTILYDIKWHPIISGTPAFVGFAWKEGNKWHKLDYYYPESILEKDGWYQDKDFKIKDGIFTMFHANGMIEDSCAYISNKRDGTQLQWNEEGVQVFSGHWQNDLPVDTALWWNKNGMVTAYSITDSSGTGLYRGLLEDGKTEKIYGRLIAGKRSGKWIFRDDKGILGIEAEYLEDSVISIICYNENGEPETGRKDCVVEKRAGFKGGDEAFKKFLYKNLQYPPEAFKNGIQGVVKVKFTIQKDGSVTNVKVLNSPDPSLSKEAVRIIESAKDWEPALQYNRKVSYTYMQGITFRLE